MQTAVQARSSVAPRPAGKMRASERGRTWPVACSQRRVVRRVRSISTKMVNESIWVTESSLSCVAALAPEVTFNTLRWARLRRRPLTATLGLLAPAAQRRIAHLTQYCGNWSDQKISAQRPL